MTLPNPTPAATPEILNRFRLDGRVILLTGAAGHLGASMALGLCEAGAHVILNGRTEAKIQSLADELAGQGYQATAAAVDLATDDGPEALIAQIETQCGRLDGIINNAYSGKTGSVDTDTVENFDEAYHLTVSVPFRLVQRALPLLEASGANHPAGASVINIASMYGCVSPNPEIYGDSGQNNPPHYGAAKAGLIQLTRYLACHLAQRKIRVNAISPGPFPKASVMETDPAFHDALRAKVPMKRIGLPEELSGAVVFLASDAASYVTGVNLPVDGGWTAW